MNNNIKLPYFSSIIKDVEEIKNKDRYNYFILNNSYIILIDYLFYYLNINYDEKDEQIINNNIHILQEINDNNIILKYNNFIKDESIQILKPYKIILYFNNNYIYCHLYFLNNNIIIYNIKSTYLYIYPNQDIYINNIKIKSFDYMLIYYDKDIIKKLIKNLTKYYNIALNNLKK